ncbi:MAG TPA: tetratricopeptide repeat protein [Aquihabitans sp.]|nr:tetratricopeptide repeat protein [Aquihabitans sp.]
MTITHPTTSSSATAGVDVHGNAMTGGAEAIAAYDRAIERLLGYRQDALVSLEELMTHHAHAPMTAIYGAYLCLTATDVGALDDARGFAAALAQQPKNEREQAHAVAIDRWLAGEWHAAGRALDELLVRWPTDLLALLVGHQLDFFVGDAANLRDRIRRSLGALDPHHPHRPYLLGMHAFGLEECGTYDDAERDGMAAIDAHPDDVWAIHAVAHVHEMRGETERGVAFMTYCEDDWSEGTIFGVHLSWHLALYHLELGRIDDVLRLYDGRVRQAGAPGQPLELVDASAMLWRLHLDGVDVGDRFADVADAWRAQTEAYPWYVFNDVHATMALVGAGRIVEARRVVDRLARSLADGPGATSNRIMTAKAGLPAARAIVAHAEGRHDDVVSELLPVRNRLNAFGGSNAQRDVIQRTLVDSAVAAGQEDLAAALLRERLAGRPTSSYAHSRRLRLVVSSGRAASSPGDAGGELRWD